MFFRRRAKRKLAEQPGFEPIPQPQSQAQPVTPAAAPVAAPAPIAAPARVAAPAADAPSLNAPFFDAEPSTQVEPSAQSATPPASAPRAPSGLAHEEGAREYVFEIMRAAPDLRYRAARMLGLLEGPGSGGGPEFERRLLERARDTHRLAALEQALRR